MKPQIPNIARRLQQIEEVLRTNREFAIIVEDVLVTQELGCLKRGEPVPDRTQETIALTAAKLREEGIMDIATHMAAFDQVVADLKAGKLEL